MNPVEGSPEEAAVARAGPDGPDLATPAPSAAAVPPAPAVENPAGGLAALLGQARAAQAQLAGQPLPISNHRNRLITQLFGG